MVETLSFLEDLTGYSRAKLSDSTTKLARISAVYDPDTYPGNLPQVIFDGESTISTKEYPVLGGYWPQPNDRVLMIKSGNTYVIAGPVNSPRPSASYQNFQIDDGGGADGFTIDSDWDLQEFEAKIMGNLIQVYGLVTRTGSNITSNASGNIVDTLIGTLSYDLWPPHRVNLLATDGFGSGIVTIYPEGDANGPGEIYVRTWSANSYIGSDRPNFHFNGFYFNNDGSS